MKQYNFKTLGVFPSSGNLHPLHKVRTEHRQIFLEMGFQEMKTNQFVENCFWNFDTLFQPQQHPARDAHDTFFLSHPANTEKYPKEYLERVKEFHEHGGGGSTGWNYEWSIEESLKNVLRTHTTASSSRTLYSLATSGFTPGKYFSIDRVYRNETTDATHLAEFHQVYYWGAFESFRGMSCVVYATIRWRDSLWTEDWTWGIWLQSSGSSLVI